MLQNQPFKCSRLSFELELSIKNRSTSCIIAMQRFEYILSNRSRKNTFFWAIYKKKWQICPDFFFRPFDTLSNINLFFCFFFLFCQFQFRVPLNYALVGCDMILIAITIALITEADMLLVLIALESFPGFAPPWIICDFPLFELHTSHFLRRIQKKTRLSFVFGTFGSSFSLCFGLMVFSKKFQLLDKTKQLTLIQLTIEIRRKCAFSIKKYDYIVILSEKKKHKTGF